MGGRGVGSIGSIGGVDGGVDGGVMCVKCAGVVVAWPDLFLFLRVPS